MFRLFYRNCHNSLQLCGKILSAKFMILFSYSSVDPLGKSMPAYSLGNLS